MAVDNDPTRLRREINEKRNGIREEAEKRFREEYRHLKGRGKF